MEIIEETVQSGKKNAIEKLGASNVGESWAMLENADWVGLINIDEVVDSSKPDIEPKKYISVKQLKIRGKKPCVFNSFIQPFYENNGMKIIDDEGLGKIASVDSLETVSSTVGTDHSGFSNTEKRKKNKNTIDRRKSKAKSKQIDEELDGDLSEFD